MNNNSPTRKMEMGYVILLLLTALQEALVYVQVYWKQAYTLSEFMLGMAILLALLLGYALPMGVSVVLVFVYMVSYMVWLAAYANASVIVYSWLLAIPANVLVAAFIKSYVIRSKRIVERLEELKTIHPIIDLDTTLGNKEALAETVIKQSNLAKRYEDRYSFCMAMFKIEFLPYVQEALGSERYAQLLLELSNTIQKQIRFEDYKFSLDEGRFVILLPMTNKDYLQQLTGRIKNAMMDVAVTDKKGRPLELVIRSGALVFQKEQFSQYEQIDNVIAALERNAELDVIGEYV
ncbi:diguanylate cyclase domain-containing protein [Brevibacillus sp. SAFN-007a]|uniref:diguanylate cyclase domain-containing protein n=1 Tax=Brevibacillus sp. SAFN-007a TaxID=3436862 RepID=UPI003F822FE8